MKHVTSEMAATVWEVLVTPGSEVEADDILVVLESMKMEIPVLAQVPGKIEEVSVKVGDTIEEGHLLVVLSPT